MLQFLAESQSKASVHQYLAGGPFFEAFRLICYASFLLLNFVTCRPVAGQRLGGRVPAVTNTQARIV
jgi:hypothetical protein